MGPVGRRGQRVRPVHSNEACSEHPLISLCEQGAETAGGWGGGGEVAGEGGAGGLGRGGGLERGVGGGWLGEGWGEGWGLEKGLGE